MRLWFGTSALALFAGFTLLTGSGALASDTRPFPPQIQDGALFLGAIKQSHQAPDARPVSGITVPHHLLATDIIADTFARAAHTPYAHILLVSPDHFHLGATNISIAEKDFLTPFGKITTNSEWVRQFEKNPSVRAADFFYREHGVQAELPFINHYFPHADIVAVTFRYETPREELDAFVNSVKRTITPDTLVIQSTDFSHYLPAPAADLRDQETKHVLETGDLDRLFSLHQPDNLDSIASQYVQMRLQKEFFGSHLTITAIKNSQNYAKYPVKKTTSYIAQIYTKQETQESIIPHASMTFVGDIMLGRYVETLMATHGALYPFKNISAFFERSGSVVGNLEGPIATPHIQTPNNSLRFSFSPTIAPTLARAHITHVSLGNNHTADQGEQGLAFTRTALHDAGISTFGDPRNTVHSPLWHGTIDGRDVTLFSLHATHRVLFADVESKIAAIKKEYPQTFLIVQPHWGTEYQEISNPSQQELAHRMVTRGADMIIGHHPHVIQEVERYQKRLIFYSLGNFIFDQYFSQKTQEELMLRLTFRGTDASIALIPLRSQKSQPSPMSTGDAHAFLQRLAGKSDKALTQDIRRGLVIIK